MIRNTEPKKSFADLDLENFDRNIDADSLNNQISKPQATNPQQIAFAHRLNFLTKKIMFNYKPENQVNVDTTIVIVRSLIFLLIEYIIHFSFQLVSYFVLEDFWQESRYIPGIILGVVYTVLVLLLVFLTGLKSKLLLYILKLLEFITAFFLLGYLAAWDFGTISLSYIMILDIILIFTFVC